MKFRLTILCALACFCFPVMAVTVTIDPATRFQVIEGFGAHGAMDAYWTSGPFFNDAFIANVIDDLGLTMIRNVWEPDGANFNNHQVPYLKALKAKADKSGEPIHFIATMWSPPARWKTNNSVTNGGSVKREHFGQFADYCVGVVRRYKSDAGIDLYALSFANEPEFAQPYHSCVWEPQAYSDFLKILAAKFKEEKITTKIFGPEHMLSDLGRYNRSLVDDGTKDHLGAFAIHGYIDGVNPIGPNSLWTQLGMLGRQWNKPVWQTEISGYSDNWASAFTYAQGMGVGLKQGNVAVWLWWQLSGNGDSNDMFILMPHRGGKGKKYFVSKNYYRFIRPGAVRIASTQTVPDAKILDIAFHDAAKRQLVLVLINTDQSSKTISLAGNHLPSTFKVYRTSSNEDAKDVGVMPPNAILLPPSSISTLVGEGYSPVSVSLIPRVNVAPARFSVLGLHSRARSTVSPSGRLMVQNDSARRGIPSRVITIKIPE